jgi:hypothetical protein
MAKKPVSYLAVRRGKVKNGSTVERLPVYWMQVGV